MVMAIANLRIQTLTRQINKANLQMMLLTSQQSTMSYTSSKIGSDYKKLYTQLNGLGSTIEAEQQDSFTDKLNQLGDIYYIINEKDTEIDEEIAILETQIQAYTKELESVKKFAEEQAKKEVCHLTM